MELDNLDCLLLSLTCLYNESTNDGVQHEMSRFLRQLLAETDIPIRTLWLRSEPEPRAAQSLVVEKTPEVMELLRQLYDQNRPDGEHITLSPSAINTYLACPIQFYLNNVLRIRREDELEENISANIIGNIFHDTAEFFYEWLQERYGTDTITASMLCDDDLRIREPIHRELQRMLHTVFDVCWFHRTEEFDRLPVIRERYRKPMANDYKGTVLIAHDVLLRYLQGLIRYDARHAPFRIIGSERKRTIMFNDQCSKFNVRVGGRIDRIDEMGGRLRIVDYKTSSHESAQYQLQICLYALAQMERKESTLPIKPVLFFPIKAAADDYNPSLIINKREIDDFASQYAETFRESLREILSEIFNPDKPFTCTTDTKVCEYCKLGQICGKKN